MKTLKFVWRIVRNLILIPLALSVIVALVVGAFADEGNVIEPRLSAEPAFDGASVAFAITFVVTCLVMIVYMIVTIRKNRPANADAEG
ncbi:MAG TPA: hypothetical protein VGF30_16640 [Bacteroidia bacterium]